MTNTFLCGIYTWVPFVVEAVTLTTITVACGSISSKGSFETSVSFLIMLTARMYSEGRVTILSNCTARESRGGTSTTQSLRRAVVSNTTTERKCSSSNQPLSLVRAAPALIHTKNYTTAYRFHAIKFLCCCLTLTSGNFAAYASCTKRCKLVSSSSAYV